MKIKDILPTIIFEHNKILQSEIDYIKSLYDDRWLLKDMSELTGRSIQDIGYVLDAYYPNRDKRLSYHAPELIQAVKDLRDQGLTQPQISDRLKISASSVDHIIDTYYPDRVKYNTQSKGITSDQIAQMAKLWADGMPLKTIGGKFGVHHGPVHHHLKKLPNYEELKQLHLLHRQIKNRKSPVSTTNVVRAGTMDNNKHKGPLTRHTWGVSWPRIS